MRTRSGISAVLLLAACMLRAGVCGCDYNLITEPVSTSRFNLIAGEIDQRAGKFTLLGSQASEEPASKVRTRQIVMFTASWCGPCRVFKSREIPRMERAGWTFGDADDSSTHFRVIDYDANPALARVFKASTLPVYVAIDNQAGGDLKQALQRGRLVGLQSAESLNTLYRSITP